MADDYREICVHRGRIVGSRHPRSGAGGRVKAARIIDGGFAKQKGFPQNDSIKPGVCGYNEEEHNSRPTRHVAEPFSSLHKDPRLPYATSPMPASTVRSLDKTHTHDAEVRLLVALPALNEEATIGKVIDGIPDRIAGIDNISTVVVDDGSSDSTSQRARAAGALVLRHHDRKGVGAAFATALRYAIEQGVDLIATVDSDGQFNPADLSALVAPVVADDADFATASRFIDPSLTPQMPWIKRWGNRRMSRLVSRLTGGTFYDVSCGMRCYSRKAMLSLNLLGEFTYTQEVFLNLAFKKLRIVEVPISVRGEREVGESRVANNLWQYALKSAKIIFRAYRDYRPMRLFGGTALVLLVPAVLLGGFLLCHFLITGDFTPYKWTGFTSGVLGMLSLMMLHMGMLGDMLNRHRIYLEELLFNQRLGGSLRSDVRIHPNRSSGEQR